jgi:cyclase
MFKNRIIPCLLINNRGLYKTIRFKDSVYVGDPANALKIFNEKEVDELVILDITATKEKKKPNFKLLNELASECFMPLCYGGGITDLDEIRTLFNLGIEKVSLNSITFTKPELISEAAKIFGSQSIVGSIDVKKNLFGKYQVHINSGTVNTKKDPVEYAQYLSNLGVGEIFLNSIDRDGTMSGYDIDLIRNVSASVPVPLIACGGAGRIEDFGTAIHQGGASAVSAGSFFVFHGKHRAVLITYPTRAEMSTIIS